MIPVKVTKSASLCGGGRWRLPNHKAQGVEVWRLRATARERTTHNKPSWVGISSESFPAFPRKQKLTGWGNIMTSEVQPVNRLSIPSPASRPVDQPVEGKHHGN